MSTRQALWKPPILRAASQTKPVPQDEKSSQGSDDLGRKITNILELKDEPLKKASRIIVKKDAHTSKTQYRTTKKKLLSRVIKKKRYKNSNFIKQCPRTGLFNCPKCKLKSKYKGNISKHMLLIHNPKKIYKCKMCTFVTKYKDHYAGHKKMHSNNAPFKCTKCEYTTYQKHHMLRHSTVDHAKSKIQKCGQCDYSCTHKTALKSHEKRHTLENMETDDTIDTEFTSPGLNEDSTTAPSGDKQSKRKHSCQYCNYTSFRYDNFLKHKLLHTKTKIFKCDQCSYTAYRKDNFVRHGSTHTLDKPFKCSECSYSTSRKDSLLVHVLTHGETREYKCIDCPYKTYRKDLLLRHKKLIHTHAKVHMCEFCSYKTFEKHHLGKHLHIHSNDKPFKCNNCKYSTARKYHLVRHMKIHNTEINSYKCLKCDFYASTLEILQDHKKIAHSEEKILKCPHCEQSFSYESDLIAHVRSHTDATPFKCTKCSFKTLNKTTYILHKRNHNTPLFKCSKCDYSSPFRTSYMMHKRLHNANTTLPFKCNKCSFVTENLSGLVEHGKTHELKSYYKCSNCDFSSPFLSSYILHKRKHSNRLSTEKIKSELNTITLYSCVSCNYSSEDVNLLQFHLKSHPEHVNDPTSEIKNPTSEVDNPISEIYNTTSESMKLKPFSCQYCKYTTDTQQSLTEHLTALHSDDVYKQIYSDLEALHTAADRAEIIAGDNLNEEENLDFSTDNQAYIIELESQIDTNSSKSEDFTSDIETSVKSGQAMKNKSDVDILKNTKELPIEFDSKRIKVHKCSQCSYSTRSKITIEKHKAKHQMIYQCNYCHFSIDKRPNFIKHIKTHTTAYECKQCGFKTPHKASLLSHTARKHIGVAKEKTLQSKLIAKKIKAWHYCDHCKYETESLVNFEIHIQTHPNYRPFKCPECPHTSHKLSYLKRHMLMHREGKEFNCLQCNFSCNTEDYLRSHMSVKHEGLKPFQCSLCSFSTAYKSSLSDHTMSFHSENSEKKLEKCQYCDFTSFHKTPLFRHMKTHPQEKMFQCVGCEYKTSNKYNLKEHINRKHVTEKLFKCTQCTYSSGSKADLTIHINAKHTLERQYLCDQCEFSSPYRNSLLEHTARKHTGEKQHKCNMCNYSSVNRNHLQAHIRTHTGEKPFKCNLCNFASAHKGNYRLHIKSHSNDKPTKNHNNTRNFETQRQIPVFSCEYCTYKTSKQVRLKEHIIALHYEKVCAEKIDLHTENPTGENLDADESNDNQAYTVEIESQVDKQTPDFETIAEHHTYVIENENAEGTVKNIEVTSNISILPCAHCHFKTLNFQDLVAHLKSHITGEIDSDRNEPAEIETHVSKKHFAKGNLRHTDTKAKTKLSSTTFCETIQEENSLQNAELNAIKIESSGKLEFKPGDSENIDENRKYKTYEKNIESRGGSVYQTGDPVDESDNQVMESDDPVMESDDQVMESDDPLMESDDQIKQNVTHQKAVTAGILSVAKYLPCAHCEHKCTSFDELLSHLKDHLQ